MNKWVYFLLIALLFLSGCRHSPSQTETQSITTATKNPTMATDTETTRDSIPVETQPIETTAIPETGEASTTPETEVTAAPTTQLQETTIPESTVCPHINTTIVNEKAATEEEGGYTGDVICLDCNELIASGRVVPPLNMVIYTGPNGLSYTVEKGTNISDYTMKLNAWAEDHPYADIEQEVFRLCNLAREKYGIAPLTWNEDAYCFTKIRAQDCFTLYDHVRPNGEKWNSVYEDHGVFLFCINGENLNQASGCTAEHIADTLLMADMIFGSWMDSDGHRENLLRDTYTSVSIAVLWSEEENICYVAQNFFGY